MKKIVTKKKIDPNQYVNIETGESLYDEKGDVSSVNILSKNLVLMDYKEYVMIDSAAMKYINTNFTNVEANRILQMADMVNDCYNALYHNKSFLQNNITLMEDLKYSRNKFDAFMKKLYKQGVIWYLKGYINGVEVTRILLNPHIARKRKTISVETLAVFNEINHLKESRLPDDAL
jgi:hypothetical protein